MPEEYNKLAEGIVKGSVPMVASFVERYLSDDEPGFFAGDREHVEGDIRVHVTVFGQLEQANSHLTDSVQLGIVDLQQLPDGRVWMVVGTLPTLTETEAWLGDLYSAMVRRMAARLVQFGFLDAPNRPRLRAGAGSTVGLAQVAQALKPPKPTHRPQPVPAPARPPTPPPQAAEPSPAEVQTPAPAGPSAAPATPPEPVAMPASSAAPAAPIQRPVPSPAALAATPPSSSPNMFSTPSFPQLDIVLTIAMVFIWVAACGLLFYLLTLLLK